MPDKRLDEPVVLISYPTEPSAAIACARLEAAGIKAAMSGGITSAFRAETFGEVQILVRRRDVEEAKQILSTPAPEET